MNENHNKNQTKETLGAIAQHKWNVLTVLTTEQDRIVGEIAALREDERILGDNSTMILELLNRLDVITRKIVQTRSDYEMAWADFILEFELR